MFNQLQFRQEVQLMLVATNVTVDLNLIQKWALFIWGTIYRQIQHLAPPINLWTKVHLLWVVMTGVIQNLRL